MSSGGVFRVPIRAKVEVRTRRLRTSSRQAPPTQPQDALLLHSWRHVTLKALSSASQLPSGLEKVTVLSLHTAPPP